jgi:Lon protease-like protein
MARPRKYSETAAATGAQRQAAKRARDREQWVEVARDGYEAHAARLDKLQAAIYDAAARGDETAAACNAANVETMLEKLAAHFEAVARDGKPEK